MVTKLGDLCCEACGVSGAVAAMHRANPKGEKGRWRCESCLDVPADPEVLAATDYLQTASMDPDTPMTPVLEAWVRSQRGKS